MTILMVMGLLVTAVIYAAVFYFAQDYMYKKKVKKSS